MLSQESITAVSQPPTAATTPDSALLPGTATLIEEIQQRLLAGQAVNNRTLTEIADKAYGGSRARGTYTPRDAYDATETAVNKLLETKASELMTMRVADALSTLRPLAERLPRQIDRTREQVQFQQFSTPPALSYIAARLLNPSPTDMVLEPSAGTGSLAIWPRAIGARVVCNEISPRRRMLLDQILGFETHAVDAEFIHDLLDSELRPTAVLMNPPFSATGGRVSANRMIYGARHVESALRRLEQGGRLVAIAGEAMGFTRPAFSDWWKVIARTYNVRANFHLTGNEYGKYGIGYGLQVVVIDKTGQTPGDNWEQRLGNINWSEADKLRSMSNRTPLGLVRIPTTTHLARSNCSVGVTIIVPALVLADGSRQMPSAECRRKGASELGTSLTFLNSESRHHLTVYPCQLNRADRAAPLRRRHSTQPTVGCLHNAQ